MEIKHENKKKHCVRPICRSWYNEDTNPKSAELLQLKPNTDYNNPLDSIYIDDCLIVMKKLYELHGSFVDLIYADPPFGRNSVDKHFGINWNSHSVDDKLLSKLFGSDIIKQMKHEKKAYVTWLYPRIEMCHKLLKDTGSMYLHCDSK